MREKIVEIVMQVNPDLTLQEGINFIKDGHIESMEIMDIVVAMEEVFEIEISPEDIVPEYFESIDTLLCLVEKNMDTKGCNK